MKHEDGDVRIYAKAVDLLPESIRGGLYMYEKVSEDNPKQDMDEDRKENYLYIIY